MEIQQGTALTVTFSRPVIALGSDWTSKGTDGALREDLTPFRLEACPGQPPFAVTGKLRWSTTAIARFDADTAWPTDLCFDLVLNEGLRSFDGVPVSGFAGADARRRWRFTTPRMSMYLAGVTSEKAANLTAGRWTSEPPPPMLREDGSADIKASSIDHEEAQECPPDAVVQLQFTNDIDHEVAYRSLRDANKALLPSPESGGWHSCGASCLAVRPIGLDAARVYKLTFPKGAKYSLTAGLAGEDQVVVLSGLLPFTFPFFFKAPPSGYQNRRLKYRRQKLYLRHGLEAASHEDDALAALKNAISLVDSSGHTLDFSLSLRDAATLLLTCPELWPNQRYTLRVDASDRVRDGFGQPLQACQMQFDTESWPSYALQLQDLVSFREFHGDWQALVRGGQYFSMKAWAVESANIGWAITHRFVGRASADPLGAGDAMVQAQSRNELQVVGVNTDELLMEEPVGDDSFATRKGLFLREVRQRAAIDNAERNFAYVADIGCAFISTRGPSPRGPPSPRGEEKKATQGPEALLVWCTDFDSGLSVSGAEVEVFTIAGSRYSSAGRQSVPVVAKEATGITGADGTVWLRSGSKGVPDVRSGVRDMVAVVKAPSGALSIVPSPWKVNQRTTTELRAELVTDRAIYRLGDRVYVKGYIRSPSGNGYAMPDEEDRFKLQVTWQRGYASSRKPGGAQRGESHTVHVSPKYGSFAVELQVPSSPEAVTLGEVQFSLLHDVGTAVPRSVATSRITVADPRPPTATLNMSSPTEFVLPGHSAALDLEVAAATYSGSAVEGAKVELTWTVQPSSPAARGDCEGQAEPCEVTGIGILPAANGGKRDRNDVSPVTGKLSVVTGAGGRANITLNIAALLQDTPGKDGFDTPPCKEGDTVSVQARWVGPTREVVMAELSGGPVKVARSRYVLGIKPTRHVSLNLGTPLPGIAIPVLVDVRDIHGTSLKEMPVELSLHEWDGKVPVRDESDQEVGRAEWASHTGLLPPSSWGMEVPEQACTASSDGGAAPQCEGRLALPAARKYVVVARAQVPQAHGAVELVAAFAVGKTVEEWAKAPLRDLDAKIVVATDKPSYEVGATATLSFVSPFENASVLAMWGNGQNVKTQQKRLGAVAGEKHSIEVDVGEECRFGCYATLVVVAPSQRTEAMLPIPVPLSPLLDVTLPQSVTTEVFIAVPDKGRKFSSDIGVEIVDEGGSRTLEVVEPGQKAAVRVHVGKEEAGAEVCVYMVDKAMLDIGGPAKPHSPTKLDERFKLARGDTHKATDSRDSLVSFPGYQATVNASLRRSKLDPWVFDYSWDSKSQLYRTMDNMEPVAMPDEEYLATKTGEATYFPSPPFGFATFAGGMRTRGFALMAAEAPEMDMAMDEGANEAAPPMMMKAASVSRSAPASAREPAAGGGSSAVGKEIYVRSNMVATPLFAPSAVVGDDGYATIPLTLPDNIATFEVRAYVVDGKGETRFGFGTTSLISRRIVSMVPSVPRVVRPGDRYECGVSVTWHCGSDIDPCPVGPAGTDPAVDVYVAVQGNSTGASIRPTSLKGLGASVALDAPGLTSGEHGARAPLLKGSRDGPQEVLFPFEVPAGKKGGGLGTLQLQFSATQPEQPAALVDALKVPLAVRAPQQPVNVATSMAIRAPPLERAAWNEGLVLPEAMPGSGNIELTAGVGQLPAVLADSRGLPELGRYSSGEAIAATLAPAMALRLYFPPSPSIAADTAEAVRLGDTAAQFAKAATMLGEYTDATGNQPLGLLWWKGDRSGIHRRADVPLNAFASFLARVAEVWNAAKVPESSAALRPEACDGKGAWCEAWSSLERQVPEKLRSTWERAIQGQLASDIQKLHNGPPPCKSDCFKDWGLLAQVRAALGFAWQPSLPPTVLQELSMDRLFSHEAVISLSPAGLARAALAYTLHVKQDAHGEPLLEDAGAKVSTRLASVYRRLSSLIRVQGRTAYVASGSGSRHSAGLEGNALVLLAIARAGPAARAQYFAADSGASMAAKLASYVAQGAGGGSSPRLGGGYWAGARSLATAILALAQYDEAVGSTTPKLHLRAASGKAALLEYSADGAVAPTLTNVTPWSALPSSPAPLHFLANGQGEVTVVASLTFVPSSLPTTAAVYRGIYLEKVVQKMDSTGRAVGPPLQAIPLGSSVVVTIQLMTPDDLDRVTLQDLTAGGLEPVDPNVAGDRQGSSAGANNCGDDDDLLWRWWVWCMPAFRQPEVFADRVVWSSRGTLFAGTYTISYQAVAATRGVFVLPAAHAFQDDAPEVMGLSKAGTIVVAGTLDGLPGGQGQLVSAGSLTAEAPDPRDKSAVSTFLRQLGVTAEEAFVPKGCPGLCPNGGICQLDTGRCACYRGMAFVDGDCPSSAMVNLASGNISMPAAPSGKSVIIVSGCVFFLAICFSWSRKKGGGCRAWFRQRRGGLSGYAAAESGGPVSPHYHAETEMPNLNIAGGRADGRPLLAAAQPVSGQWQGWSPDGRLFRGGAAE